MLASSASNLFSRVRGTFMYPSVLKKIFIEPAEHLKTQPFQTFFLLLFFLISCQKQEPVNEIKELRGEVFGSYYLVKYRGELPVEKFQKELNGFFDEFNKEFSTYKKDSVISDFNRSPKNTKLHVSTRFIEMLKLAKEFHEETEGAFDPTLGPVIKAWGFGGGKKKSSDDEIKKAWNKVGFHHVKWDEKKNEVWKTLDRVELDVNAFAPGWAADLIGDMLIAHQVTNFMVDISGEILFRGMKDEKNFWIGGIEKPSEKHGASVHLAFKMKDEALATSGNYRQFFDENGSRKSHIIDPRTGRPVSHNVSSASVIADSAASADAWGTALMVLGTDGLALCEKHGKKVLLLKAVQPGQFEEITSDSMKAFLKAQQL